MVWINLILLLLVIGLNVADLVLTVLCLRIGGTELNTLFDWLMDKIGTVPALILLKIIIIGILLAVSYISWPKWYLTILLALATAGYVLVVVNNVKALRTLTKAST